jgi:hypothetical protein
VQLSRLVHRYCTALDFCSWSLGCTPEALHTLLILS